MEQQQSPTPTPKSVTFDSNTAYKHTSVHGSSDSLPMIYGFKLLIKAGLPMSFDGTFRDNIHHFLLNCAKLEDYNLHGMSVWRTSLVYESNGKIMPLYTIEEDMKQSNSPFCDYCRLAGWRHHLMSKKKYHLIIPENDEWNNPFDVGVFHLQSHLLNGLIHSNGYGHLICVNGVEGGSEFIRGKEIMDLWDRICTSLHVRKISVNDLSRKHNMDLRLLYGVSFGKSWFGRWDYQYSHGRFEVKEEDYQRAMNTLSSTSLDEIIEDFCLTDKGPIIEQIIHNYRGMSDTNLVTIRDIFSFMLNQEKENRSGKENTTLCGKFSNLAMEPCSVLPIERFEYAAQVIVDALKEKRGTNNASSSMMTRQELRDAARLRIDSTRLIDRVLKVMNNVIIGNCIVRSAVNRYSKFQEYTVQYITGGSKDSLSAEGPVITTSPEKSVLGDITYLYKNVLCGCSEPDSVNPPVQMILLSKHFVKDFPSRDKDGDSLLFTCRLTRSSIGVIDNDFRGFKPGESVTVPVNATVGDLKLALEKEMRETYCASEKLTVLEILGLGEGVQDSDGAKGLVEPGRREIWFKCSGLDLKSSELRFEGRKETQVVNCDCGTQEHDGERMVACNQCEVWRHTRCNCIADEKRVPLLFTCDLCSCASSRDWYDNDIKGDLAG